jgi:hypothetical protein
MSPERNLLQIQSELGKNIGSVTSYITDSYRDVMPSTIEVRIHGFIIRSL